MVFRIEVSAYANNEVAFMSWQADRKIPGCLGFEIFANISTKQTM